MKVSYSLRDEVAAGVVARAAAERRSVSSMASLLLERALGAGAGGVEGDVRQDRRSVVESTSGGENGAAGQEVGLTAPAPSVGGPLFARAGCLRKIPQGERCLPSPDGCGAVHQP